MARTAYDSSRTRIDLHLHSDASGAATNWWVKGLGFGGATRESYTPPAEAYRKARAAGMDFVTLTDHESVDGVALLAGHPDVLTGVEVCATFPEGGSTVDILIYGLNADEHREIQSRRGDVHELVAYLREAGLVHVLAHPMFEANGVLDRAGIEKRLVLFGLWELINGSRPANQNRLTERVAAEVGAIELRQLARLHGLPVPPHHRIAGTGGSDDHGGVHVGTTWTSLPRVTSVADLLAAMRAGELHPGGDDGSVEKMAHTGFRIAGLASAAGARPAENGAHASGDTGAGDGPLGKLRDYLPLLANLGGEHVRALLAGMYEQRVADAVGGGAGASPLGALSSVGSFIDGHLFVAPYLAIHGYFGRERQKTRALRRQLFAAGSPTERVRVGVFVDQMDEIHGVATMYRNLQRLASRTGSDSLRVVFCGLGDGQGGDADAATDGTGAARLPAVTTLPMPLYPGRTLGVPSLLDVLDHIDREGYDVVHVATPGPLGLAALVAGNTLGLPVVGAYHTEFGQYARVLSGDALVADLVELVVREFYQRCAAIAVPSAATAASLRERGYTVDRFEILRNGVDTDLYRPERRDQALHDALGGGRPLLVYMGRVSREKGLERLVTGYRALRERRDDVHLVVIGDGPYREEMEATLASTATFTGFLQGEELARTLASCDAMVFPSTTDTLGRAVAEAQASGLPAVVFDSGGPRECLVAGVSGFVVGARDDAAFWARAEALLDEPGLRERMSRAAREFSSSLTWDSVLDSLMDLYRDVCGLPAAGADHTADPERRGLSELIAAPVLAGAGSDDHRG